MSRFRFSIKYLLALVALIGGGCAALTNRSQVCAYIVCITFGSLLVFAPVVAIYGRGGSRRFAGGFALAAWIYAMLMMWQLPSATIPGLHSALTGLMTARAQQPYASLAPATTPPVLAQPPGPVPTVAPTTEIAAQDVPASLVTPQANAPADNNSSTNGATVVQTIGGFPVSSSGYPWEISPEYTMVNGTLVADPTGLNYLLVVGHALAAIAIGFLAGVLAIVLAPAESITTGASLGAYPNAS